jgi:hypothetical protein
MPSTAISAQGTLIQIATGTGGAKTITGVAVGNPTILTATAHGFSNGDLVAIAGLTGADAAMLNSLSFTVTNKTTNTFAVQVDTTGKTITAGSGTATPTTYTTIGNCRTFTGLDGTATELDKTNLQSGAKEIALGLVDFGQFSFECDHDNADAGQAALLAAYNAGTSRTMKMILPAGTTPTAAFTAYIKKFTITGGIDCAAQCGCKDLRLGHLVVSHEDPDAARYRRRAGHRNRNRRSP